MAKTNYFTENGKPLVSKVTFTGDLEKSAKAAMSLIGGLEKLTKKGETILLKPNYNTADPYPGSSDPEFIRIIVKQLYGAGAGKVIVGERSAYLDTWKVLEKAGVVEVARRAGAEVRVFGKNGWRALLDRRGWKRVKVTGGCCLRNVAVAREVFEVDKIVYAPLIKTHHAAGFTGAIKLSMGLVKPFFDQIAFHMRNLQQKLAELMLVVKPDLVIMDARKVFITGGPARGELRTPNLILASGDQVAIDVEGVKVLQSYPDSSLRTDVWNLTQIKHAVDLGIGPRSERYYKVVAG
ncbi:MAG: DUF362 domain-containing protein [Candidatus Bathyarchaeota archaeon]|nr:DUF362 domain-containing protein [Candidatus Bathyarchaeota archaeon]